MNFFKIKTAWSNAELIPLKVCIATAYVVIGAYFHTLVHNYFVPLIVVFGITVIWSVCMWLNKMKNGKQE